MNRSQACMYALLIEAAKTVPCDVWVEVFGKSIVGHLHVDEASIEIETLNGVTLRLDLTEIESIKVCRNANSTLEDNPQITIRMFT